MMNKYLQENTKFRFFIIWLMLVTFSIFIKLANFYGQQIYSYSDWLVKLLDDFSGTVLSLAFIGFLFELLAKKNMRDEFLEMLVQSFYQNKKIFNKFNLEKQKALTCDALKFMMGDERANVIFNHLVEPYIAWDESNYKLDFEYIVKLEETNDSTTLWDTTQYYKAIKKSRYKRLFQSKKVIDDFFIQIKFKRYAGLDDSGEMLTSTILENMDASYIEKMKDKNYLQEIINVQIDDTNLLEDPKDFDVISSDDYVILKFKKSVEVEGITNFLIQLITPHHKHANIFNAVFYNPTSNPVIKFFPPVKSELVSTSIFCTGSKFVTRKHKDNAIVVEKSPRNKEDAWVFPDSAIVFHW